MQNMPHEQRIGSDCKIRPRSKIDHARKGLRGSANARVMNGVMSVAGVFVRTVSAILAGVLVGFVRLYQVFLSPAHGPTCRFQPSCSAYAIEALQRHGPIWGLVLTAWRLARCHPLGGLGYDPVPVERPSFKLVLSRFIHGSNHSA